MSHYKPYPRYKDSGVEWLGRVPEHWELAKVAWDMPFTVGWTPASGNEDYYSGEFSWANISDLSSKVVYETVKTITAKAVADRSAKPVPPGSLLFSFKLSVGLVSFAGKAIFTNEAIAAFHPSPSIDLKYLYYCAPIFIPKYGRENIYGALLLNQDLISSARTFLPPLPEQRQIATFLDRETTRIDALIEKKQRLVELLKEKRQVVITQAVTKGLDPNVPVKDSGVEWLGEVPENWAIDVLKHFCYVIDCKHLTAEFVDEGIPLASIREVQAWEVNLTDAKRTTDYYYKLLIEGGRKPQVGDIIYSRNATVGEAAMVTEEHQPFAMGQDVCLLRNKDCVVTEFLLYQLRSPVVLSQLEVLMVGATFRRINVDSIRNFLVAFPPVKEQRIIMEILQEQTVKIDILIAKAEESVMLLKERRSALITAAVTGQIDVRDAA